MVNRRTVTFGTLALAMVPAVARADAGGVIPEVEPLSPRIALKRKGDQLLVSIQVTNTTTEPMDLLTGRGSRPGAYVQAFLDMDGERLELAEVVNWDRREMMSRAGPRPSYTAVAGGASVDQGPYTFTLPEGVEDERVTVVAQFATMGTSYEVVREGLSWNERKS